MQIHSIPKSPKQKAHMQLSDLHKEEFKLFSMECNITGGRPDKELDHHANTVQCSNEYCNPGINDMFLSNLDPTLYAMQKMQHCDVLIHAQMKGELDAGKIIDAQRPEIEGLMDLNTVKFIHKKKLSTKTRYLDLTWTYRYKICPYGSLKKYKAHLCVNSSRQIQVIYYT
jgi:hypothetical protein